MYVNQNLEFDVLLSSVDSIFLLFVFVTSLTMKAWFRSIAAAFAEPVANSVAGLSVLALAIYTGYVIPKPLMIGALRWIAYINVRF